MKALLVIDVQNDFCPGGALAVSEGDAIIPLINRLSQQFHHVLFTQDWHPPGHSSFASQHSERSAYDTIELPYGEQVLWPDHCVQGSHGAELHPALNTDVGELIVRKGFRKEIDSYSAFYENDHETPTGLAGYARERNIDAFYIVGLAMDFCVAWSAVDGRSLGFEITVLEDASRPIDTEGSLEAAMRNMNEAGVRVASSDSALARITDNR